MSECSCILPQLRCALVQVETLKQAAFAAAALKSRAEVEALKAKQGSRRGRGRSRQNSATQSTGEAATLPSGLYNSADYAIAASERASLLALTSHSSSAALLL
jgi:hypothetical protein